MTKANDSHKYKGFVPGNAAGNKIVMMTPDEYIEESIHIFNNRLYSHHLKDIERTGQRLEYDYMTRETLEGDRSTQLNEPSFNRTEPRSVDFDNAYEANELTMPNLDWESNSQDGLHRAIWARDIKGLSEIPVKIHGTKEIKYPLKRGH